MFHTLVVQPIFNLLALIYALIPGHNFGLAIILFTVLVRLLMWPLVKRQLRQTKITRQLQPDLKRIKKEAAGNRQKETMMMMELYKERGVNPFATLPILVVQMILLFGLYAGLVKVIKDPHQIAAYAYGPLQNLSWLKHIAHDIHAFDNSLFGLIDLSRPALGKGGVYYPALVLVVASAVTQFASSKQLMPVDKDARKLRHILREAGDGKQADQSEVNAAVGRSMMYVLPVTILLFTVNVAAALSLYWFVGGLMAYLQQRAVLKDEGADLVAAADAPQRAERGSVVRIVNEADIPEGEVVETPAVVRTAGAGSVQKKTTTKPKAKKAHTTRKKKRR